MTKDKTADLEFCEYLIRKRRAIRNKIVILCEGDRSYLRIRSPQDYGRLDRYQDAAFWKETIPSWWREKKPEFIPCGDRHRVLKIREKLLDLHYDDVDNSYLNPDKLFVLIDLDLQPAIIDRESNYNTEQLYDDLYQQDVINPEIIDQYKTIVTGFKHKEAYFFEPDLQEVFNNSEYDLSYQNKPLILAKVYQDMLLSIKTDTDIKSNLKNASDRLKHLLSPLPSNCQELWQQLDKLFNQSSLSIADKRQLITAILTIVKSKDFWLEKIIIKPTDNLPSEYLLNLEERRDNLMHNIAKFYARSCQQNPPQQQHQYHICQWINHLNNKYKAKS